MAMPFVEKVHAHDWMRTYCHVVGIIQCFYGAFFGRMFWKAFGDGRFYHPAFEGKGFYSPAYFDFAGLFFATVFALLAVTAFIGGCGLVGLRGWVRRWEAAYLGVLLMGTAVAIVEEMPRAWLVPESLTPLMLFSVAFSLPYLPFLCDDVVAFMARVARLRVRNEGPVAKAVGVWDASLDG
jgi:hypothetical protein